MSYLDSAMQTLNNAVTAVTETVEGWSVKWQQTMDEMKTKAAEFLRVFYELENKRAIAQADPALRDDYNSLMDKGAWIKRTIEALLADEGGNTLSGMGIAVPLIPIAAVLAAIAAISAFLAPAYVMLRKLDLAEKAMEKGYDPGPIIGAGEGGLFEGGKEAAQAMTTLALVVGGGFILWKFWPQIQKRLG